MLFPGMGETVAGGRAASEKCSFSQKELDVVFAQWAFCAFTVQTCMPVMCEHWA